MKKKFLISESEITIGLKGNTTLIIGGIYFQVEGEIKFMEKLVHLQENSSSIVVFVDNDPISKQNYYTSIKKQDIHYIWFKGENLWEKWQLAKTITLD